MANEDNTFWVSYSGLATGLMIVFMLVMLIMVMIQKKAPKPKRKPSRRSLRNSRLFWVRNQNWRTPSTLPSKKTPRFRQTVTAQISIDEDAVSLRKSTLLQPKSLDLSKLLHPDIFVPLVSRAIKVCKE